jgi:hypothetical protein
MDALSLYQITQMRNPWFARVFLTSDQNLIGATNNTVAFDTVAYDPNNNCNLALGTVGFGYTAPTAGYYLFTAGVFVHWGGATSGQMWLQVYVSPAGHVLNIGTDIPVRDRHRDTIVPTGYNDFVSSDICTILRLNQGDSVALTIWTDTGGTNLLGSGTAVSGDYNFMDIMYLGPQ